MEKAAAAPTNSSDVASTYCQQRDLVKECTVPRTNQTVTPLNEFLIYLVFFLNYENSLFKLMHKSNNVINNYDINLKTVILLFT